MCERSQNKKHEHVSLKTARCALMHVLSKERKIFLRVLGVVFLQHLDSASDDKYMSVPATKQPLKLFLRFFTVELTVGARF